LVRERNRYTSSVTTAVISSTWIQFTVASSLAGIRRRRCSHR
jgi:hypothetical protein